MKRLSNRMISTQVRALVPLEVEEVEELLVLGVPTGPQFTSYWGRNSREKYAAITESGLTSMAGMLGSYFLSFLVGNFAATLLGFYCASSILLTPEIRAYQRNWELLGGRKLVDPWTVRGQEDRQGLYGALYLGVVADVTVVEDAESIEEYDLDQFQDYTMETDELEQLSGNPYLLRVKLSDTDGRTLQVHARMSEEYLDLRKGQSVAGVLLSTSQKFTKLAALTDFVVPKAGCWIGDYPYLNRPNLERLINEDDDLYDIQQEEEERHAAAEAARKKSRSQRQLSPGRRPNSGSGGSSRGGGPGPGRSAAYNGMLDNTSYFMFGTDGDVGAGWEGTTRPNRTR